MLTNIDGDEQLSKEFFDKVKGKAIRHSEWSPDKSVVPTKLRGGSSEIPWRFEGTWMDFTHLNTTFIIANGLEPDVYGGKWVIIYNFDEELENL